MYLSIDMILLCIAAIIGGFIVLKKYNNYNIENNLKAFREIVAQLKFDKNLREYDIAEDLIISNRVYKFVNKIDYRLKTYEGYSPNSIYILLLLDVLTLKFDNSYFNLPIAYKILDKVKEKKLLPEELYKAEYENIKEIEGRYKKYQDELHNR